MSADEIVKRPFFVNSFLLPVLDQLVKPILIIGLCLLGLIFEFLVELPFIVIIGFHRLFGGR